MQSLSRKEETIMRILWKLKHGFVNDIIDQMESPKPPYNTVSSTVRKLVKDGVIGFESFGKTHRYYPLLQQDQYKKHSLKNLVSHYFSGSPKQLLSYFVQEEELTQEEIESLLNSLKQAQS